MPNDNEEQQNELFIGAQALYGLSVCSSVFACALRKKYPNSCIEKGFRRGAIVFGLAADLAGGYLIKESSDYESAESIVLMAESAAGFMLKARYALPKMYQAYKACKSRMGYERVSVDELRVDVTLPTTAIQLDTITPQSEIQRDIT